MSTPEKRRFPLFKESHSAETVNARIGSDVGPPTRQIAEALAHHLHAAVKEIEPTQEEWLAAIRLLTDTGHMCTDWRQEFILLSDAINSHAAANALFAMQRACDVPLALRDIGMPRDGIPRAVDLAMANRYANPRAIDPSAIARLLEGAWSGMGPEV